MAPEVIATVILFLVQGIFGILWYLIKKRLESTADKAYVDAVVNNVLHQHSNDDQRRQSDLATDMKLVMHQLRELCGRIDKIDAKLVNTEEKIEKLMGSLEQRFDRRLKELEDYTGEVERNSVSKDYCVLAMHPPKP